MPKSRREILEEFRTYLGCEREVDASTDAVVVLSIRPPHNAENTERIKYGWEIVQRIVAKKVGKPVDALTTNDMQKNAPFFILNAETECLEDCLETAVAIGVLRTKIILLDCGSLEMSHTKSNMEVIAEHPQLSRFQHLTFVTSGYHAPRVARTASKNLPPKQQFVVHSVPLQRYPYQVTSRVRSEIRKIQEYADKGDISPTVR